MIKLTDAEYDALPDRQTTCDPALGVWYRDSQDVDSVFIARFSVNKRGYNWEQHPWKLRVA